MISEDNIWSLKKRLESGGWTLKTKYEAEIEVQTGSLNFKYASILFLVSGEET